MKKKVLYLVRMLPHMDWICKYCGCVPIFPPSFHIFEYADRVETLSLYYFEISAQNARECIVFSGQSIIRNKLTWRKLVLRSGSKLLWLIGLAIWAHLDNLCKMGDQYMHSLARIPNHLSEKILQLLLNNCLHSQKNLVRESWFLSKKINRPLQKTYTWLLFILSKNCCDKFVTANFT